MGFIGALGAAAGMKKSPVLAFLMCGAAGALVSEWALGVTIPLALLFAVIGFRAQDA
jgi:hypothetical protein